MISWDPIVAPARFHVDARSALAALEARRHSKQLLKSTDFASSVWTRHTDALLSAVMYRCAYCESDAAEVDHFFPKSEVAEAQPATGEPGRTALRQGKTRPGYFWLAYDWDNYVPSCMRCNQRFKRNLFPVRGGQHRSNPGWEHHEPLLLYPFGSWDPIWHFESVLRVVAGHPEAYLVGRSPEGVACVATYGLNRPGLIGTRGAVLASVARNVVELAAADRATTRATVEHLIRQTSVGHAFAGGARMALWQTAGLTHDDLVHLVG